MQNLAKLLRIAVFLGLNDSDALTTFTELLAHCSLSHEILATEHMTINLFMQIDPVAILIYSTRQFGITHKLSLKTQKAQFDFFLGSTKEFS